jgi:hypothetical protein
MTTQNNFSNNQPVCIWSYPELNAVLPIKREWQPVTDENGVQRRTDNGVPIWKNSCRLKTSWGGSINNVYLRYASSEAPNVVELSPIQEFLTTHSPEELKTLVEAAGEELA